MTKTELLDRCARDREERILLGRVLDKGELTRARGIPAHTVFLSPGQRSAAEDMLNAWGRPRCLFWGGYEGAERTLCAFLPDWQEEEDLKNDPDGPVGGVEAVFTALALHDDFVPATINYQTPDPECDLDYVPNQGRSQKLRYAASNSLGFGGHNACLVLKKWEA